MARKSAKPSAASTPDIESILKEKRVLKPSREFAKKAHVKSFAEYKKIRKAALRNPQAYWARAAKELDWFKPWKKVLAWKPPFAKWFVGGKINIAHNCLDRHIEGWRRNKAALLWEGEPGDRRTYTYQELHREVCRFANVLKESGVKKGDRVAIYMPMIPELPIAMLACARIGAVHSIVFGGFSADALRDRINDAEAKLLITADGGWRRGSVVPLKQMADDALKGTPTIERSIVVKRIGEPVNMQEGRDFWWHEAMEDVTATCPAEKLDSEHPLFILYTSGSTGKPKGVMHTTGGYLTHVAHTARLIFDLKDEDTYWCTADIGWVTGHSYIVYGILANGATSLMYEGAPNYPANDRFWDIVERHRVTILYTAPTAIRTFMKWGDEWPNKHDLSSLRLLGTVGEPINPEAWMWYHRVIGKKRCPIVDTWWQTETGGILITPLPGAVPTKPGSCTLPFPGIDADVVTKEGKPVPPNSGGFLVLKRPWPGMLRTIYGDPERYKQQYWSDIPGMYFAGDGARRDKDGYFWVMGRIDDVMNVAGHRLSTMEIESALVSHPDVAEAAVVGKPDDMKGTAVTAFVTLESASKPTEALKKVLREHVGKEIGPIAKPDEVRFTDSLPKTRSGKIMRRLLRDIASGEATVGDTTTLEDYSVLAKLRESEEIVTARGLAERVRFGPVEVLPGPDGGRYPYSHALYVHGPEPAVIDPGMTFDPARHDLDTAGVAWVLNSHCHEDHEGGNHHFANAKVIAPAEDAPFIRSLDAYAAANGMTGKPEESAWRRMMTEVWGFRESPVHREVADGEVVEIGGSRMRFVYLPGHTPGHAGIWFEDEEVFFIADVDLTSFGPFYGDHFSSIEQFLDSIRRVREMNPRTIVTSHGRALFEGQAMRDALDRFEGKILQRDEAILKMLADRPHTLDEIVDAHLVYRRYPEPAAMYREIEKVMIEKHLVRLEKLGQARVEGDRWSAGG